MYSYTVSKRGENLFFELQPSEFLPDFLILESDKSHVEKCLTGYKHKENYKCEGLKYALGIGNKRNINEALVNFRMASNLGDKWSEGKFNWLYARFFAFDGNYYFDSKKSNLYDTCHHTSDGWLAFLLSQIGFNKDSRTFCLKKAVELNNYAGMCFYGIDLFESRNRKKDGLLIFDLWTTSHKINNNGAITSNLGLLHQLGIGVDKDLRYAEMLYLEAAKNNSVNANLNLAILYEDSLLFGKSESDINHLYRIAADRGNLSALISLKRRASK
jgi:TPR repeat protein